MTRFYCFLFLIEHTDKVKSQTTRVHIVGENHLWPGICVDYFLSFPHIFLSRDKLTHKKSWTIWQYFNFWIIEFTLAQKSHVALNNLATSAEFLASNFWVLYFFRDFYPVLAWKTKKKKLWKKNPWISKKWEEKY